ncbi:lysoplasmalogenase [Psychroserpens sp.]|uniref:lysoplasmalogenase n=1 Tax=Psychroserpens sp. TaxID=2020870 RepID=UPI001B228BD0|nr:lysoplasmalogenase [Psychroserpens sp.]MBO6607136.1 lysoplasmalogenase [Psychroserpens sp.]MBO6630404.1 lysoplasmalogenase [Psychroserpens sp.]MBO6654282.1 lysoplasmalogenase [Psychroserpens sp.]MBO6682432.1 lysoplasmalogenase [Psychroserpens sp.]MBO6750908.1 lysoplasmalogenase [Psychroserpens sp.]
MQSKALKLFSIIFVLITTGELITANSSSFYELHYIFKPAIITSLIFYFWSRSKSINSGLRVLIFLALLCSVIGDVLLMFVEKSPNYFLFGLISFLIAHVLYVLAFNKQRNKKINPLGFTTLLFIYAVGLFYLLYNGLNEMLIPVVIYMLVILSMATTAYTRKGSVNRMSYILVLVGAILFLVSDSILALNKFYQPQIYANISIMLTYALAQYFIIIGMLNQNN